MAGCRAYWTNPDVASYRQFALDNQACAREATGYSESVDACGGPGGLRWWYHKGFKISEAGYRLCMQVRGYKHDKYLVTPKNGFRGITDELDCARRHALRLGAGERSNESCHPTGCRVAARPLASLGTELAGHRIRCGGHPSGRRRHDPGEDW